MRKKITDWTITITACANVN